MPEFSMEREFIQKKYFCKKKQIPFCYKPILIMKSLAVLCLLTPFLFSLVSCTKEESQETPVHTSPGSGSFYATIDGSAWQGDSIQQAVVTSGIVTITGIGKTQDEISIVLPALQKGVYAVNSQSVGFALYTNTQNVSAEPYLSNTSTDPAKAGGTVGLTVIDTVNKTISGTFQFKLFQGTSAGTKIVENGVFTNIPYSVSDIPTGPTGNGDGDSLSANIENVFWSASQVFASATSGQLIIGGFSGDGQPSLDLLMPDSVSPGTYTLDLGGGYSAAYNSTQLAVFQALGNGSLTIAENDMVNKHIKGTFSFVGQSPTDASTANVTSGYFSVNY
jgi:hypothetical protein